MTLLSAKLNTMDNVETGKSLPIEEILAMDGLRGVDPSELFGIDMKVDLGKLPPHAQTYYALGTALRGSALDSWGPVYGLCRHARRQECQSFEAVTQGLSIEEKVRFCVVLMQFLRDIDRRGPDFVRMAERSAPDSCSGSIELEVLRDAEQWVFDMKKTIDDDTLEAGLALGDANLTKFLGGISPKPVVGVDAEVVEGGEEEAAVVPVVVDRRDIWKKLAAALGRFPGVRNS